MKRIRSDKIILPERVFDGYVYFDNGKISEITAKELPIDVEYDLRGYFVSAGFIDVHTHGGGGYSFDGSVDDIVNACNFHFAHGTTSICPTVSADDFEVMKRSAMNIERAMSDPRVKGSIIGVHMEGPYLSAKQSGAQCASFITEPRPEDYLPFIKGHSNAIARWTYAPENDPDGQFEKSLREYGIVASAGHTDAIYEDMCRAEQNGCTLVTHLYSCTSTVTRDKGFRRLGVIEYAYLSESMFVEIICDGKHLPPELIRLIYKIKGADRILLVTDSLALAGTEQTHGFMQNTEYIIEDGVCKLIDRSAFAGSVATADRLLRVAVHEAGIPICEAVKMMTSVPASVMGLSRKGSIAENMDADLVAFDGNVNVVSVFSGGRKVH